MRLLPITARKALSLVALTLMGCVCTTVTTSFAPRALAADENYQLIQEPEAGFSRIIDLISGAARSVRITMYELTDPASVNALIDAHGRGVDTRVMLDAAFLARSFGLKPVAWSKICHWGVMFYDSTAPARFDPVERRAKRDAFGAAAYRIDAGEASGWVERANVWGVYPGESVP